ncbi:MAG: MaoC/PaaZ C-terminal domain-containing protein [Betaproteobacteria bacterium]
MDERLRLPALPALPGLLLGALGGRKSAAPDGPLPALEVAIEAVTLDAGRVAAYRSAFGFRAALPLSYLYLPAQRAQLALFNRPDFPLRALGLVHVANDMRWHAQPDTTRPLALEVRIVDEEQRRSGRHFRLLTQFSQAGQPVASIASAYLARAPRRDGSAAVAAAATDQSASRRGQTELRALAIGLDAGWRYARLSGDWNPIHLSRWSARPFGLAAPIAHGMCVAAQALAALEQSARAEVRAAQVQFLKPVPLGTQLSVWRGPGPGALSVWLDRQCVQRIEAVLD